jgi:hypothetical protein
MMNEENMAEEDEMFCKKCGAEIHTRECPNCGTVNELPAREGAAPNAMQSVGSRPEEKIVYQGSLLDKKTGVRQPIIITPQRVTIGNATYSTANITSVSIAEKAPVRIWGILLAILGLAIAFITFNQIDVDEGMPVLLVSVSMVVIGVLWAALAKGQAYLAIVTAAGEIPALWSQDREMIRQLVRHIETAIIARG